MLRFEKSIEVDAPVEQVFAYLVDPAHGCMLDRLLGFTEAFLARYMDHSMTMAMKAAKARIAAGATAGATR